jgi:hypothetical protein
MFIKLSVISMAISPSELFTNHFSVHYLFRNGNMRQVIQKPNRWYNADIIWMDQLPNQYKLHNTFMDKPMD